MKFDGQLYDLSDCAQKPFCPPGSLIKNPEPCEKKPEVFVKKQRLSFSNEDIMLIGIIFLLLSDKCEKDLPLILALCYILIVK